jgi:hypothetical protein
MSTSILCCQVYQTWKRLTVLRSAIAQEATTPSESVQSFAQGITSLQMMERAIANLSEIG